MAKLLRMPGIAANTTHAVLHEWTKGVGEKFATNDCLAMIETDKAVVELIAENDGVIGKLLVTPNQEVEVGAPIAVLLSENEIDVDISALLAGSSQAESMLSEEVTQVTQHQERSDTEVQLAGQDRRIFASPLARRMAERQGIDLAGLSGTGPNGRIVKRDIEQLSVHKPDRISTNEAESERSKERHPEGYVLIPHSSMRRSIARRLVESKSTIPHFYLSLECRVDRLLSLRHEINAGAARKLSINDFVVRAVAASLREFPAANVGWTEAGICHYAHADIAVAVSTDGGLITPIVRAADTKSISAISAEVEDLAARARSSGLRPEEYQGGSFSISNLGMYGVQEFSAIINPPQAAILAVGAVYQSPVVEDGAVKVASVMRCNMSVDHRAIDGAIAAQWLSVFKRFIEQPLSMLV